MASYLLSTPRTQTTDAGDLVNRRMTLDGRWQNAFDRAATFRRNAQRVSLCHYRVHSEDPNGPTYDVVYTGNGETGWECSCPSGFPSTACKHRARVLMRLAREYRAPRLSDFEESGGELFDDEVPVRMPLCDEFGEILLPEDDEPFVPDWEEPAAAVETAGKPKVRLEDFWAA